jgi:hypothetical protein
MREGKKEELRIKKLTEATTEEHDKKSSAGGGQESKKANLRIRT